MASERNLMVQAANLHAVRDSGVRPAERKRSFWLGWVAAFGVGGTVCGVTALIISLLTALAILNENRSSGIAVSGLVVGCLASLLLAAHGMDRMAAARRDPGN
jgi:hypothetical protein